MGCASSSDQSAPGATDQPDPGAAYEVKQYSFAEDGFGYKPELGVELWGAVVAVDVAPAAAEFAAALEKKAEGQLTRPMLESPKMRAAVGAAGEGHAGPVEAAARAFCRELVLLWAMLVRCVYNRAFWMGGHGPWLREDYPEFRPFWGCVVEAAGAVQRGSADAVLGAVQAAADDVVARIAAADPAGLAGP